MQQNDQQIIDSVLAEFLPLCKIPHSSRHEQALSDYLVTRLEELGLCVQRDALWNIWADAPASAGRENEPTIAFQAHMDMVCAANTPDFNPLISQVQAEAADGWLSANGRSSLGADCGAGIALILWLLGQKWISHPPLRIIFTVQEEIGLLGAMEIPKECVEGVSVLLNIDGFALNRILVGSAGGMREHYARAVEWVPSPAGRAYQIKLSGFTGGHSGFNIKEKRANAVILMGEVLRRLQTKTPFAIADFSGGEAFNAIPYQCTATIISAISIEKAITEMSQDILARHRHTDPNGSLEVLSCDAPAQVWAGSVTAGFLTLLGGFADGVYAMHPELEDCVSDSSNLGHAYIENDVLCLDAFIRFMDTSAEYALHQSHSLVAGMCGFSGTVCTRYPAWNTQNRTLASRMAALYHKQTGKEMQVLAQHVGLEPSYFMSKNPEMECVCLGMDIEGCHSPDERWRLASIPVLARMLAEYLANP